ncbi:M20 family peptidase [Bradyrhizobium sp.]|uniref:M20 family peptidase n=1 Tax=Bradyrhizobium sp. TaxID=376 RepID=UPI0023A10215|nr:M20 family peptidase [Bradyrhizobium sp.]MDE2377024.1 M20 family peptidase [Bradyrhizobium sp.]
MISRTMRGLSWTLPALLLGLVTILAARTWLLSSRQPTPDAIQPMPLDVQAAAERLAGAVRIRTISNDRAPAPGPAHAEFREFLERQFPRLHQNLKREIVNESSLLFTWQGHDPTAAPILLMAHSDVVPIAPGTESKWTYPPFEGVIADGYVWGRGAWDDKGCLMAIMEAVERLIANGERPRQTVYLAFGHDEETGTSAGEQGAKHIAALLKKRGVHLAFVLDEGLLISEGGMSGLDKPVALIGVAEKGYMNLSLSTEAQPGHSSLPPERMAISTLAVALDRVERKQMNTKINGLVRQMLETVAPEIGGVNRVLLSNLWLFDPVVRWKLEASSGGRAMLRTTLAPTIFNAGNKESSLPGNAQAVINFRLLPGDSKAAVLERTRRAVADDSVSIEPIGAPWEATPVSRTDSAAYERIRTTVREVFPDAIVAPGLMMGFTDSRHYIDVADDVYRFTPVRARNEDLARFHGTDERISLRNYAEMIRFYARLMTSAAFQRTN